MVNKNKIKELVNWRAQIDPNWPWLERDFIIPCMKALGDDEKSIINFLSDSDQNTLEQISTFSEILFAKFPSEQMGEIIDKIN